MRHILVTGATDGIGKVTARELGAEGTSVWIVGRNAEKTAAVVRELTALKPGATYHGLVADLARPPEVSRLGRELLDKLPHLDVLVNNAGAFFSTFEQTPEGFERTFALNHLNYFILTHHLLPALKKAPKGRVVSVASDAHRMAKLDFDNLQGEHGYKGWTAYGRSKLCNILFTRELARRLAGGTVTANSLHPGFVASKFGHNNVGAMNHLLKFSQKIFAIDENAGAKTSIYLASSAEAGKFSGQYFSRCKPSTPTLAAQDDSAALRLWTISEQIAAPYLP
jgi:NAD(P)-dependent dehydrogenase (short-subunit alcohol dehydrogenase family)